MKEIRWKCYRISADSASLSMNFYFSFLLELFASLHGTSQHERYRKEQSKKFFVYIPHSTYQIAEDLWLFCNAMSIEMGGM
jgi:hypothetical protein